MISPSQEQQEIVNETINGNSIFVDAVAGSGKTTTIYHIVSNLKNKKIVILTYNSHLKLEVRQKIYTITKDIDIHTYHSLGYKYYSSLCIDDSFLQKIIKKNIEIKTVKPIDIIIIDETQDMTSLYHEFLLKFIKDINFCNQLIILGDKNQGIYEFKNADVRFLTLSNYIYKNITKNPFIFKTLKESFRLTKQMAWFINNVLLNENRIIANKNGPNVNYVISDPYKSTTYIFNELKSMFSSGSIKYDDVFILSPSIKRNNKKTPLSLLENKLVNSGIPCFVPFNDEAKLDNDIIKGKVIFTTFHQSKGRERKIVIVLGFDSSYFIYFNKVDNPKVCPSILYVAATRASHKLYIMEDPAKGKLQFIDKDYNYMKSSGYINIITLQKNNKKSELFADEDKDFKFIYINDLVKYIKDDLIHIFNNYIEEVLINLTNDELEINIPTKILCNEDSSLYEEVSDINTDTIKSIWENKHINNNTNSLLNTVMKLDTDSYGEYIKNLNVSNPKIKDYMLLSNIYISMKTNYIFKLSQIKNYDWLNENIINECIDILENNIEYNNSDIELYKIIEDKDNKPYISVNRIIDNKMVEFRFTGDLGISTHDTIWTIKCSDKIKMEDFLKVIVNYYVYNLIIVNKRNEQDFRMFKILNFKKNQIWKIRDDKNHIIEDIVDLLIESKYGKIIKLNNNTFIQKYCI